jgi:hypothetical protein
MVRRGQGRHTEGYGHDITGVDVLNAYAHTIKAAENPDRVEETRRRIGALVATRPSASAS